MTSFEDRKKAYEAKFAHDEMARFKAEAERNRIVGAWAAEQLGLHGQEQEDYVKAVIASDMEEAGDEDVLRKILADFEQASLGLGAAEIREQLDKAMLQAAEKMQSE